MKSFERKKLYDCEHQHNSQIFVTAVDTRERNIMLTVVDTFKPLSDVEMKVTLRRKESVLNIRK